MKTPQTMGIEYEILDLEGDLDGTPPGPAHPQRCIDDRIALLSGGLFDNVPRVDVPLDSYFPPPPHPSRRASQRPRSDSLAPASLGARSDSLVPSEMDAMPPPAPSARRATAITWSGRVTAAALGMIAATLFLRTVSQPPASASLAVAQPPVVAAAAASPSAPTASTPAAIGKPAQATAPIAAPPAKPARAAVATAPQPRNEAAPAAPPAAPSVAPAAEPAVEAAAASNSEAPPSLDAAPPPVSPQRAAVAVAAAARGAASCLDPDDLRRTMAVTITFAPSGRATRATVDGGPHRGTAAGSCIAQRLRSAVVSPFEGAPVTVRTSVSVR